MGKVVNYIILIAFNTFVLFNTSIDGLVVISLCISLIFLGLEYVLSNSFVTAVFYIIYTLTTLVVPELMLFYPIIIAGAFRSQYYSNNRLLLLPYLISIPLVFNNLSWTNSIILFIQLFGMTLSILLIWSNIRYDKLTDELIKTVDDSREINYLLKERNKSIVEKQDYEIYAATLRERNRISREIHDNVGHLLSRAILINGAVKTINKQDNLDEPINSLDEALNSAMSTIRSSVHDMHNESINLYEAINTLTNDFNKCNVDFKYDCTINVPTEVKYSFISIIKEALSNIIKHSNASNVYIIIREHPGIYQLIIEDNGTKASKYENTQGIGLNNMRDRVTTLKGNMNIRVDEGFKIFITIPKHI